MEKFYRIDNGQLVEVQKHINTEKKVLTPEEARLQLGLSRNTFMALLYSNKIRAIKAGRRWLIPIEAFNEFLSSGVKV